MSFTPIETQEKFDEMVRERLARERAKYADYDELKAKAAKFDEAEEARKSDLEKANERISELEAEAKSREEADRLATARAKVSRETGVPADLISGTDEESMTESAKAISAFAKATVPPAPSLVGPGRFVDDEASSGASRDGFVRELDRAFFGDGSN